jgi:hypothetical protein
LKNCVDYTFSKPTAIGVSISDNVSLAMKNNQLMFMKIFMTDIPKSLNVTENSFREHILPLMYEQMLCLSRINKLIKQRICPFFIETKGGNFHIPFSTLFDFLKGKLIRTHVNGKKQVRPELYQPGYVSNVLIRNIDMNLQKLQNRIDRKTKYSLSNYVTTFHNHYPIQELQKVKFGYILTTSMHDSIELESHMYNLFKSVSNKPVTITDMYGTQHIDITPKLSVIFTTLSNVLFQVAIAISALQLSKTIHNDLHGNNILVEKFDPNNLKLMTIYYNWNPQTAYRIFNFRTNIILKLFDFDRSFVYGNKNSELPNVQHFVRPNLISNKRDFLKLFQDMKECYDKCIKKNGLDPNVKPFFDTFFDQICSIILRSPVVQIYNIQNKLVHSTKPNQPSHLHIFEDFLQNIPVDPEYGTKSVLNRNISDRTFDAFREPGEIAELLYDLPNSYLKYHTVHVNESINYQPYVLCSNMFDADGNIVQNEKIRSENQFYSEFHKIIQQRQISK